MDAGLLSLATGITLALAVVMHAAPAKVATNPLNSPSYNVLEEMVSTESLSQQDENSQGSGNY